MQALRRQSFLNRKSGMRLRYEGEVGGDDSDRSNEPRGEARDHHLLDIEGGELLANLGLAV